MRSSALPCVNPVNPVEPAGWRGRAVTHRYIERLSVESSGEGAAVVLLHGLGGSSNIWVPLMPALARHHAVCIDLPGAARSARAHVLERGPLTIEAMASAVQRVCVALGIERAWFVGHSLGTIVCQHLAAAHGKLVQGLALFGALPEPPESARGPLRQRAARARAEGMAGIADAVVQASLSSHSRSSQLVTTAMVRELLMGQDPETYARSCEALADAQAAPLADLICPVLLVTGDEDAVAPPHVSRDMAARLRQARVEVLPRCGHWTPLERGAECARLLGDFLTRGR